jgi:hypothetical protein
MLHTNANETAPSTTRDALRVVLGNLRASRFRLDVPTLDSLTWDDLADLDQMLGEAIEEVTGLLSPPSSDPHDREPAEYHFEPSSVEEAEYAFEEEAEYFITRQMEVAR